MINERVIVTRYGGPEVLDLIREPLRPPHHDEVRIKVQSSGVALADIMRREGVYLRFIRFIHGLKQTGDEA